MKGRVELLLHMHINVLNLLTRDAVVHGFGVDCLSTAGRMLIMGKSVTAEEMPADRNVIPEEPEWPLVRMEYRKLQVALEPLSPTTTRACLMIDVDAKLRFLPQTSVEWVLKRTLGVIFMRLTNAARKIGQREGPHYQAVQADRAFYEGWLQTRIAEYLRGLAGT